jgi:hypothetical protein
VTMLVREAHCFPSRSHPRRSDRLMGTSISHLLIFCVSESGEYIPISTGDAVLENIMIEIQKTEHRFADFMF